MQPMSKKKTFSAQFMNLCNNASDVYLYKDTPPFLRNFPKEVSSFLFWFNILYAAIAFAMLLNFESNIINLKTETKKLSFIEKRPV